MAANIMKIGTLSVERMLKMEAAIRREIELESGMRINHKRVHKSKKTYTRKGNHTNRFDA